MSGCISGTSISLLNRIKIFAETFVESLNDSSLLSIVSFTDVATTCMNMTRMDQRGQTTAKGIIQDLQADGPTNISDGLLKGLLTTRGGQRQTRDCIVLFTDGEANEGILDAGQLVHEYNSLMDMLEKPSRVPISAFTIGDHRPYLLHEISTRLGSEAFYWLNEECDFEADLFAPMLLRESTTITDISVTLTCLGGVTFSLSDVSTQYLQNDLDARSSTSELTYFIHNIPRSMTKHIYVSLFLPPNNNLDRKYILKATKTFLDVESRQQMSTDYLELRLKCMNDIVSRFDKESSKQAVEILQNTSAYCVKDSKADDSWQATQIAYASVLQENCRQIAINNFQQARELLSEGNSNVAKVQKCFQDATDKITKIKDQLDTALGSENTFRENFCKEAESLKEMVQFGDTVLTTNINWGRLASMESSLASEMPAGTGVFDPDKPPPFMTQDVQDKLGNYRTFVKTKTEQFVTTTERRIDRYDFNQLRGRFYPMRAEHKLRNLKAESIKQRYERHDTF